jgi:hypothetical protein
MYNALSICISRFLQQNFASCTHGRALQRYILHHDRLQRKLETKMKRLHASAEALSVQEEDSLFTLRIATTVHLFQNAIEVQQKRIRDLFLLSTESQMHERIGLKARWHMHHIAMTDESQSHKLISYLDEIGCDHRTSRTQPCDALNGTYIVYGTYIQPRAST